MKLSKKLLTTLLPIAATGAIVPAVTSCNRGSGYTINFGDTVDCLNEKADNYHSLSKVKDSIVKCVSIEESPYVHTANLPKWDGSTAYKQMLYFDLIASLAFTKDTKFKLSYDKANDQVNVKVNTADEIKGKVEYFGDSDNKVRIRIVGQETSYSSYAYQRTTLI